MKKQASFSAIWPSVYQKILSPPPEVMQALQNYPRLQKLKGILPQFPMTKFKVNPSRLQSNPQAVGHVSTEDMDGDGKIDTINLNSPRIEEEFSKANVPLGSFMSLGPEQTGQILDSISEVILHEIGHFGGQQHVMYDPENPEATFKSEQEAESFVPVATNIKNKFDKTGSFTMSLKTLEVLADLATKLDKKGATKVADFVDQMIEKYSSDISKVAGPPYQFSEYTLRDVPFDWGRHQGGNMTASYYVMAGKPADYLGSVQIKGDPFTYDPAGPGKLVVVSAPEAGKGAIGRVIDDPRAGQKAESEESGLPQGRVVSPGSKELYEALKGMGFGQRRSETGQLLGTGVPTLESVSREKERLYSSYRKLIREALDTWDQGVGATVKGMLSYAAKPMLQPGAGRRTAIRTYNDNVRPMLSQSSYAKEADALFRRALGQLEKWESAVKAERLMVPKATSMADDGAVNHAEDEKAEELKAEASLEEEDTLKKIARLKGEYDKIFWTAPGRPFNRSNSKFKG